jgi:hypothetical protein
MWIRETRQLLDSTGKNSVVSCASLSLSLSLSFLAFNFSTYFPHLSFLALVFVKLLVCFIS